MNGREGAFLTAWFVGTVILPASLFPDYALLADDRWYVCGRLFGLMGLAVCLLQPVTMSALAGKWLGGRKLKIHQFAGIGGLFFLLLHPVLLSLSGDGVTGSTAVSVGQGALLVLVLASAAFLLVKWKIIKFPLFSRIHLLAFPAGLTGFVHAYFAGYTMRSTWYVLCYYLLLAGMGILAIVVSRIRKSRNREGIKHRLLPEAQK